MSFRLRNVAKVSDWLSPKTTILVAGGLFVVQAAVLAKFGAQQLGAVLSELIQLTLGFICLLTSVQAFRRSGNVARYYWRWLSLTFCVWIVAQALGVYIDLSSNHLLDPLDDLLFFLSVIPFGMLIFLDPDHESNRFDRIHLLDFTQVCIFWVTVYLYFSAKPLAVDLGRFKWTHNLAYDAMLTGSFLLRAFLTDSTVVRAFFARMALFLLFSGLADSYAAPTGNILPGNWFDMVWSLLLGIPIVIAATWNQEESGVIGTPRRAQRIVINELFPLLYPLFSLLLLAQVARTQTALASSIMLLSFAAVGARILIIQHRLLRAQQGLQFEAAHDALTSLWNHGAILDLLQREVERHGRNGEPVGLMMVDLDHFKNVNDAYGHMIGDLVLQEVAFRLSGSLRSYDSLGRYGGEEFLVVLPGCTAADLAMSGERLRCVVADRPIETALSAIPVTVSIGLVSSTVLPTSSDCLTLLRVADAALYSAKSKGRNRVEHASMPGGPRVPRPTGKSHKIPNLVSQDLQHFGFDSSETPMWVFDTRTLAFLVVNDAAVRHYGYSREQFSTMTILDIRPTEDPIPLLREELHEGIHNSNKERWKHLKKDGTLIEVKITSHEAIFDGHRAEIVTAVDVTAETASGHASPPDERPARRPYRD